MFKFKSLTTTDNDKNLVNPSTRQSIDSPNGSIKPNSSPEPFKVIENDESKNEFFNTKRLCFFIVLVIILCVAIAAAIALIVLYATRPSLYAAYNQSCLTKQCDPSRLLSCINSTCQCYDFYEQVFNKAINGCETKSILQRFHGELCLIGTTTCLNTTQCINSICQCNSTTQYWNGTYCESKKLFNEICTTTVNSINPYYAPTNCVDGEECVQCMPSSLLICNSVTNKCDCQSSSYYYDTTLLKCMLLKSYFSYCTSNSQCDAVLGLKCMTSLTSVGNCPTTSVLNRCDCANEYYYDFTIGMCNAVKDYYRPCTSDCECDTSKGLQCNNNYCGCKPYTWYNNNNCVGPGGYLSSCTDHNECSSDYGLSCINSAYCGCLFDSSRNYWDSQRKRCIQW